MRKFLTISIPIVLLSFFIFIMLSSNIMKKSFGNNDKVEEHILNTIEYVEKEQWNNANNEVEDLHNAWDVVLKRVQFSSELDEINNINNGIARLKGSVLAKDKGTSLSWIFEIKDLWNGLGG